MALNTADPCFVLLPAHQNRAASLVMRNPDTISSLVVSADSLLDLCKTRHAQSLSGKDNKCYSQAHLAEGTLAWPDHIFALDACRLLTMMLA